VLPHLVYPPHRCPGCRLIRTLCVCAAAPRLTLRTRVEVIMHAGEWPRTSNSGHLVQLTLANAGVRVHGLPERPLSTEGIDQRPGALLALFPGFGARPLTASFLASRPEGVTLLVPDGNWGQTKSMMRRLPLLRGATPVALPGPILELDRPRRNAMPDRMATFEAIAQALGCIEDPAAEEALLAFFRVFALNFHRMRGKVGYAGLLGASAPHA
jgi:DTW domain-containing protein YfiP